MMTGHRLKYVCRRVSKVVGPRLNVECRFRLSKVCGRMSQVVRNRRNLPTISNNVRMFDTNVALLRRYPTNISTTIDDDDSRRRTCGNLAQIAPFWRCLLLRFSDKLARRIFPLFFSITLIFLRSPCLTFSTSRARRVHLILAAS